MKLHGLYIKEYKILKDFRIDFDNPISVLIGMNGSGKSTVLEVLAEIFSSAFLGLNGKVKKSKLVSKLVYNIVYSVYLKDIQEVVTVSLEKEEDAPFQVNITLENTSNEAKEFKVSAKDLFPNKVVVYYSGWNEKMELIASPHESDYEEKIRDFTKQYLDDTSNFDFNVNVENLAHYPSLSILYLKKKHFNMLASALFSTEFNFELNDFFEKNIPNIKLEDLGIGIWLKKPHWAATHTKEKFWGTKGELLQFLNLLDENAGSKNIKNYLYFGIEHWRKIKDFYGEEKKIFYLLNALDIAGLLDIVEPVFHKDQYPKLPIGLNDFSEGEQQLLLIKAINELLIEENTLCLFDEPDVYLHPKWQGEFIKNISENNTENTQYVITTHSTVMLSNLKDGALYRMKDGKAQYIENGYYGKGYENNLENYFEVGSRNEEAAEELANLFQLIDEEKYSEATQVIDNLQVKYPNEPELTRAQTLIALLQEDDEI